MFRVALALWWIVSWVLPHRVIRDPLQKRIKKDKPSKGSEIDRERGIVGWKGGRGLLAMLNSYLKTFFITSLIDFLWVTLKRWLLALWIPIPWSLSSRRCLFFILLFWWEFITELFSEEWSHNIGPYTQIDWSMRAYREWNQCIFQLCFRNRARLKLTDL